MIINDSAIYMYYLLIPYITSADVLMRTKCFRDTSVIFLCTVKSLLAILKSFSPNSALLHNQFLNEIFRICEILYVMEMLLLLRCIFPTGLSQKFGMEINI